MGFVGNRFCAAAKQLASTRSTNAEATIDFRDGWSILRFIAGDD
jgi:hypothetical protein